MGKTDIWLEIVRVLYRRRVLEQIFYNGKIITMSKRTATEELKNAPEAVLVRDGVIIEAGTMDEVLAVASAQAVKKDLNGNCLMPSFIDTHSHFVMNGQMSAWADLSDCESFEDLISVLTAYIEKNKITEDGIVMGYGYDHNFLKEGEHPDKSVLDQVSSKIPIFVLHISAHMGCANSAALRIAGMSKQTPDPQGGVIGRIKGSDEPSGYVEEAGMNLIQQTIFSKMKIDFHQMMSEMQKIYIENGITTVQDGASTEADINLLLQLSASGELKLDVVAYPLMSALSMDYMMQNENLYKEYVNRFRIGGCKLVLDGSPQGRSAWISEPYLGGEEEDYCGYPWLKDCDVQSYVKQAVEQKWQILAHCNGDAASEQFINAYEKAVGDLDSKEDLRPVMIHCQTVRNDQLERMERLHMIASIFVGHVWYWGDIHMKNFGTERGQRISPVRDAIDRGVIVTFHQDTPVTKPNMLHSIWCAVNRISRNGNMIGEDQAIEVYDALKAVTINAAFQYFEENTKGSIEKGKKADFVILNQSPLEINNIEIKNINVLETIKDGETIFVKK